MKDVDLLKAVGKIRPEYIEEAETPKTEKKKTLWSKAGRYAALAAGLALAVLLGVNAPKLFQRVASRETTPAQEMTPALTLPENRLNPVDVIPAAESLAVSTEALSDPAETTGCEAPSESKDWGEKIEELGTYPGLPEPTTSEPVDSSDVAAYEKTIRVFSTFRELEENEKKLENGLTAYYVPAVLGEKCSLIGISKREGVYLATSYQIFTQTMHPDAATAYEKELVGSILCTQYLFSVTEETISFFQRNFREINYNGRVCYYSESRSTDKSVLLGYEIAFIFDQTAFYMHLPAVNSFEEMMRFTELEKHFIDRTADAEPAEETDNLSFYGSIEDFLEAQKQDPGSAEEVFFVPDLPPEEYQLVSVSKRDGVYISLLYKVVDPAVSTEPLSAYDAERRTMLICTTYLSQNDMEMFVKNGFRETVFDGNSYYVWEEHAENDSEKSLNGYEIVFLKDGKRVFMYLPATDSFEKLMRYADPEKRIVGE